MLKLGKKMTGLTFGLMLLVGFIIGISFAGLNTTNIHDHLQNRYYNDFFNDFAANTGVSETK